MKMRALAREVVFKSLAMKKHCSDDVRVAKYCRKSPEKTRPAGASRRPAPVASLRIAAGSKTTVK